MKKPDDIAHVAASILRKLSEYQLEEKNAVLGFVSAVVNSTPVFGRDDGDEQVYEAVDREEFKI